MKLIFISLFSLLLGLAIFAQDTIRTEPPVEQPAVQPAAQQVEQPVKKEKKPFPKDKLYYGGHVNLSFGSYTVIGIEPMVGYKILPKLSAGIKIRYDYISDKRYAETYNSSMYGGSIFARLRLFKGLYVHAEYAGYNYELYNELGQSSREWVPFLFLGGGYSQRIGGRTSLNAQVVFDVLQSSKSPYSRYEPFYSVGVGVGF